MDHIRTVLPNVLRKRGLHGHATAALAVHKAQEWLLELLPGLAGSFAVEKLVNGVLTVACRDSVTAQECHALASPLLRYLQTECGLSGVIELRVTRS